MYALPCGESLLDILKNKKVELPWEFIIDLALNVCRGIMYLHQELHLFHGNLKPSNVIVSRTIPKTIV